jgi:hypothetical protein
MRTINAYQAKVQYAKPLSLGPWKQSSQRYSLRFSKRLRKLSEAASQVSGDNIMDEDDKSTRRVCWDMYLADLKTRREFGIGRRISMDKYPMLDRRRCRFACRGCRAADGGGRVCG